jgi:secondary thiamine-phosphate synthase enzyme
VAPAAGAYRHNDFTVRTVNMTEDECANAHAHCRQLLMAASETIPIVDGEMCLGTWQRIFLVELDHPRERSVIVQVLGQ